MERILEPEVMDEPAQAEAYARADFAAVNEGFVERFVAAFPELRRGRAVDLGSGPADIPIRLTRRLPELRVVAVDASLAMLRYARDNVAATARKSSVDPLCARLPALPLPSHAFDAVISNSLLHHLPHPAPLWREVRRLARPGAAVLVMDLHRPATPDDAAAIVRREAAGEPEILRRDFLASLHAAFTVSEVERQIRDAGLRLETARASDRHWIACGFA